MLFYLISFFKSKFVFKYQPSGPKFIRISEGGAPLYSENLKIDFDSQVPENVASVFEKSP